jgi:hypothetical protein
MKKSSIFVQIASYRDSQLVPTVRDAIGNSSGNHQLVFGICHQHGTEDAALPFVGCANSEFANAVFRIDSVPYQESRGACWARNRIQQLYDGETYTLHLDSHHRFVPGWDQQLVDTLQSLQADKPLLTSYLPAFNPDTNARAALKPVTLGIYSFGNREGVLTYRSYIAQGQVDQPIPARFYSGHFCFGPGSFAVEVQHDPDFYFLGEELSLSVRAFTHGYDLFHPHKPVAWHEYTRQHRPKHWDDHSDSNAQKPDWKTHDQLSKQRYRVLLGLEDNPEIQASFGKYGLGRVRTLRDYERYAGLHFASRSVEPHTREQLPPPGTALHLPEALWFDQLQKEQVFAINLPKDITDNAANCSHWSVSLFNTDGRIAYSQRIQNDEMSETLQHPEHRLEMVCFANLELKALLLECVRADGKRDQPMVFTIG